MLWVARHVLAVHSQGPDPTLKLCFHLPGEEDEDEDHQPLCHKLPEGA